MVQCFIDNDEEGVKHTDKVIEDKLLNIGDVNLCSVPHLPESELEDLYDKDVYGAPFQEEFGVDLKRKPTAKKKRNRKWSTVVEALFRDAGRPWNKRIKMNVKDWLAEFAAAHSDDILNPHLAEPVDNFIRTAERKLAF